MIICENKKGWKAYNLVLSFLKQVLFFVLGVTHGNPIFAEVGDEKR